jgi:hypothetical protein
LFSNPVGCLTSLLTEYGVLPRYPNELQITIDDVKTVVQYAKDIKEFVARIGENEP